ncbi:MAG: hypothetical protein AABY33_08925 [Pseudomonadota bacterium]
MVEIFRLKVALRGCMCEDFSANYCTRALDISGNASLEKLAEAILDSYDFAMDHAFGFYNNLNNHYESDEAYSLFADFEMDDPIDSKSVKKTRVSSVFEKDKTMMFLFDYGDDWIFHVRCLSVGSPEKGRKYPVIVESKGKAPEQYPDYEEEGITKIMPKFVRW